MSERARIASWWVYVVAVLIIFEFVFARTNFAFALVAALAAIGLLGGALKLVVWAMTRRHRRALTD